MVNTALIFWENMRKDAFAGHLRPQGSINKNSKRNKCQLACKPGSVRPAIAGRRDSHSSRAEFASCLKQPTRMTGPETDWNFRSASSLFGFAPGGVYPAISVARNAVSSYLTLSPLPRQHCSPGWTVMQAGRFTFCGTFPGVSPAGRYPAPCFRGARTFLPPLSFDDARRGCPANWHALITETDHNSQHLSPCDVSTATLTGTLIEISEMNLPVLRHEPDCRRVIHLRIKQPPEHKDS